MKNKKTKTELNNNKKEDKKNRIFLFFFFFFQIIKKDTDKKRQMGFFHTSLNSTSLAYVFWNFINIFQVWKRFLWT